MLLTNRQTDMKTVYPPKTQFAGGIIIVLGQKVKNCLILTFLAGPSELVVT